MDTCYFSQKSAETAPFHKPCSIELGPAGLDLTWELIPPDRGQSKRPWPRLDGHPSGQGSRIGADLEHSAFQGTQGRRRSHRYDEQFYIESLWFKSTDPTYIRVHCKYIILQFFVMQESIKNSDKHEYFKEVRDVAETQLKNKAEGAPQYDMIISGELQ